LCTAREKAVFSILPLCASPDLSETRVTLRYRYGRAGSPELVHPERDVLAREAFEGGIVGALTYTVESVLVRGRGEVAGVPVREGAGTIFEGRCREPPLGDGGWGAVYRAELPQKPYMED
jgi:hypothetical protein